MKIRLILLSALLAVCAGIALGDAYSDGGLIYLSRQAKLVLVDDTSEASTLAATSEVKSGVPDCAMYQLILRCIDYSANVDSQATWVCIDYKQGENGTYVTACSTRFTVADSSGREVSFSFSQTVAADTTRADGWYFGDYWRTRYKMYDSTAQGTVAEQSWGRFETILKCRKF